MIRVLQELIVGLQPLKKTLLIFGSVAGGSISVVNATTSSYKEQREWNVEFSGGRLVSVNGTGGSQANCEKEMCGDYFALNGYDKETLPNSGSFATLGVKKKISNIRNYGRGVPALKGEGVVTILFCSQVKSGLNGKSIENNKWGSEVCQKNWMIPTDGRLRGNGGKRNGLGWYIIGFIWDEKTQYFGFISEKNLIGKVLNTQLSGKGLELKMEEKNNTELFSSTFKELLDKPIKRVSCLHLSGGRGWQLLTECNGWESWAGTISIPMGYVGSNKMADKKLRDASLVIMPIDQVRVKDGKLKIGNNYEWATKAKLTGNFQLIK